MYDGSSLDAEYVLWYTAPCSLVDRPDDGAGSISEVSVSPDCTAQHPKRQVIFIPATVRNRNLPSCCSGEPSSTGNLTDVVVTENNVSGNKDGGAHWRGGGGSNIANGNGHTVTVGDAAGGGETDASKSEVAVTGGDKLEGTDAVEDDALHLKRRVGLFSGVALIVGTMIGEYISLCRILPAATCPYIVTG
jgi:hypothetical protein